MNMDTTYSRIISVDFVISNWLELQKVENSPLIKAIIVAAEDQKDFNFLSARYVDDHKKIVLVEGKIDTQ